MSSQQIIRYLRIIIVVGFITLLGELTACSAVNPVADGHRTETLTEQEQTRLIEEYPSPIILSTNDPLATIISTSTSESTKTPDPVIESTATPAPTATTAATSTPDTVEILKTLWDNGNDDEILTFAQESLKFNEIAPNLLAILQAEYNIEREAYEFSIENLEPTIVIRGGSESQAPIFPNSDNFILYADPESGIVLAAANVMENGEIGDVFSAVYGDSFEIDGEERQGGKFLVLSGQSIYELQQGTIIGLDQNDPINAQKRLERQMQAHIALSWANGNFLTANEQGDYEFVDAEIRSTTLINETRIEQSFLILEEFSKRIAEARQNDDPFMVTFRHDNAVFPEVDMTKTVRVVRYEIGYKNERKTRINDNVIHTVVMNYIREGWRYDNSNTPLKPLGGRFTITLRLLTGAFYGQLTYGCYAVGPNRCNHEDMTGIIAAFGGLSNPKLQDVFQFYSILGSQGRGIPVHGLPPDLEPEVFLQPFDPVHLLNDPAY